MPCFRRYDFGPLMNRVTVRFAPTSVSQGDLMTQLAHAMRRLEREGVLEEGHIEAVFPGDQTPRFKGDFVVTFYGAAERVTQALNEVPGVRLAYVAPSRTHLHDPVRG